MPNYLERHKIMYKVGIIAYQSISCVPSSLNEENKINFLMIKGRWLPKSQLRSKVTHIPKLCPEPPIVP